MKKQSRRLRADASLASGVVLSKSAQQEIEERTQVAAEQSAMKFVVLWFGVPLMLLLVLVVYRVYFSAVR